MKSSYIPKKECRLCEKTDLMMIINFPDTPAGDKFLKKEQIKGEDERFPLSLKFCNSCGHLQLGDVVNPEILYFDYIYETKDSLGLVEHFKNYAATVQKLTHSKKDSLVIDMGCNDGTLLQAFKDQGMKVLGVEPAKELAIKNTKNGIETLPTFFSSELAKKIKIERGKASVITANNVFANIDDLKDVIAGVRELLTDDGVFVMETGYAVDTIRNNVIDNVYHEHISYFSVRPLKAFYEKNGLELIHVDHVDTKGGSIRTYTQLKGGPKKASPAVASMIAKEVEQGFDRPDAYLRFAKDMENIRVELNQKVDEAISQGKTVVGFGASVGVTTLLYYYGLGGKLKFLVDDNPNRQFRFSPGHHLPVLPSKELSEKKPEVTVLFPWRYAEVIMGKQQNYLKNGGKFIVPLPEIREATF